MEESMVDLRKARCQRLQHIYGVAAQLVMHEGNLISGRINILFGFNSIFFAAFMIVRTQATTENVWTLGASLIVPIFGIFISILQIFVIGSSIASANFWRSTAGRIENDEDFWWPEKVDADADLDLFLGRSRVASKQSTQQAQEPIHLLGGLPVDKLHALTVIGTLLPGTFILLWVLALLWGAFAIVSETTNFHITGLANLFQLAHII